MQIHCHSKDPETHRPKVLVVDDSRLQRRILCASLNRWGFNVTEAASGPEALEKCAANPPDLVISDWMMPGMNGPDFCQAFRAMERDSYGYFILLTSKSEAVDVAQGLDAGADDFLTKPVSGDELRARLNAGERILRMEQELVDKNRLLSSTLEELQALYDSLDSDLIEARKLQQSLIKERNRRFGDSEVSLLLRPSGHVGGDLVGFFPIDSRRVGLFAIDVSGHGVASALMTARLAGYLSGSSADQNIALFEGEFGIYDALPPEQVAERLNNLTLDEIQTETYFTLLYAEVDLVSGHVMLVQAGHPYPAIQRADGTVETIGSGGMPVGLMPDASFERVECDLGCGDRLFIVSDGVTECESPDGKMFDEEGLSKTLANNRHLKGQEFLEAVTWDLHQYAGEKEFSDDVSAVLFEFTGPKRNAD
ncbi:PP2C family protein-serine/threonine phosphatase [Aliiruegeria sabulilitoris]|uniref:PP2C family protein-serine/threonine phosphatase n=1 Tax=Aliiruegeria sabulilitoris TaxID=1510458 RepID=UPI00082FAE1F|nr:SpoIIE family protein phosphatase [Aliiruegeria sabulilitoris]NDR57504.1 fused response regulator/phosphatase [Pseudoruegeria sp. M32A2M]